MTVRDIVQAAAGVGGGVEATYIEDVFSTYLYTGNGSTQTITNDIDLDGEGGLVWIKNRNNSFTNHRLVDTVRGATKSLVTNAISAETTQSDGLTAFTATGFTLGDDAATGGDYNYITTDGYVSWTFRKAPKFFDIVTYTGTGSARTVSHSLGSVPGFIIVKRTDTTSNWQVYHRGLTPDPETDYLVLNSTAATADSNTRWNDTAPTDSVFTVGTEATVNASGGTYVAYLFAHDAGGFGDDGEQNVISCGSMNLTTGNSVNLGWEPQWILFKTSGVTGNWFLLDTMRPWTTGGDAAWLTADTTTAEGASTTFGIEPTATGFTATATNGNDYIYVAIRRGPMKTPTSGTEVFGDVTAAGEPSTSILPTENGVLTDLVIHGLRINGSSFGRHWCSRLTGANKTLISSSTAAESTPANFWQFDNNEYAYIPASGYANNSGGTSAPYVAYSFNRAPGFFDVVCWTPDADVYAVDHNLGVTPELIFVKGRDFNFGWRVYVSSLGNNGGLTLNSNAANAVRDWWNSTSPTSTQFTSNVSGGSGFLYVAYLFATLAGISKVGSYTGTGTTLAIDCGFSTGARFVMIKRTDSTGDWYFWDSARGIVAGNDPYLLMNSTAAQVTNTDYVDTSASGFEITSTAPAAINASGGNFIFLAIA